MKNIFAFLVITVTMFFTTSCSVYMASKQPRKKDLSVLKEGTPRGHVIAELGSPMHTESRTDGRLDIYKFVQGYHGGVKAGRALFHGTADVLTLGLWEIFATPIEGYADGTEIKLEVFYDKADKVNSVKALSGAEELGIPDINANKPLNSTNE